MLFLVFCFCSYSPCVNNREGKRGLLMRMTDTGHNVHFMTGKKNWELKILSEIKARLLELKSTNFFFYKSQIVSLS